MHMAGNLSKNHAHGLKTPKSDAHGYAHGLKFTVFDARAPCT